jgi:hypothetical protein
VKKGNHQSKSSIFSLPITEKKPKPTTKNPQKIVRTSLFSKECRPMHFADAFSHFKAWFFDKTGIAWDDRLDGLPSISTSIPTLNRTPTSNPTSISDRFRYMPPSAGRPVGVLPPEKEEEYRARLRRELKASAGDAESDASVDSGVALVWDSDSEVDEDELNEDIADGDGVGSEGAGEEGDGDSVSAGTVRADTPVWSEDEGKDGDDECESTGEREIKRRKGSAVSVISTSSGGTIY